MNEATRKLITNLNNNYVHWDKFKDMQIPDADYRLDIWARALVEREQGFFRRLNFGSQIIKWWVSNSLEAQLHQLDIGLAGGRQFLVLEESRHIHRHKTNAALDESINAALLAGIAVSKKMAKEMLLKKRPPQNKNEQACVNIFRALQWVSNQYQEPLTLEGLLQLHQIITKDIIPLKGIGRLRTNAKVDFSAIDTTSGYKPPAAEDISELMAEFLAFYNDDATPFFIHPLIKAAIIHYLICYFRPFKDGNGRVARLLAQMYLMKKGYLVMDFISVSNVIAKLKLQYHKSFSQAQSDENNIGYFIRFYIQSVQMAYHTLRDFALRITKEKTSSTQSKLPGYNERQTAVIQWLKDDAEKVVTIRELRSIYGISKETARTDLTTLVEKNWLQYYHINKKTYAFVKGARFNEQLAQIL